MEGACETSKGVKVEWVHQRLRKKVKNGGTERVNEWPNLHRSVRKGRANVRRPRSDQG